MNDSVGEPPAVKRLADESEVAAFREFWQYDVGVTLGVSANAWVPVISTLAASRKRGYRIK